MLGTLTVAIGSVLGGTFPTWDPEHLIALSIAGWLIGNSGQDEEQVREPVEVGDRTHVDPTRGGLGIVGLLEPEFLGRAPRRALRGTHCGTADVQLCPHLVAPGQDEGSQDRNLLVECIAPSLQTVDAGPVSYTHLRARVGDQGIGNVCSDVEELVLDDGKSLPHVRAENTGVVQGQSQTDGGIGLVNEAVCLDSQIGLRRQ